MLIVHVNIHVKSQYIQAFKEATILNAKSSIREPGIARFDFIEQLDDPNRFMLIEVYRTAQDPAKHKEMDHYKEWRDKVEVMMVEPRTSIKFENVFPNNTGW